MTVSQLLPTQLRSGEVQSAVVLAVGSRVGS